MYVWRKYLTASVKVSCGRCYRSMGYLTHCSKPLYNYSESLERRKVALLEISGTNLHWVLDGTKAFLCHRLCSEFLWTEILVGAKLWKASTLVASSLLLVGKVVLLASSEIEPIPLRNDRNQLRWLDHLPSTLPDWPQDRPRTC